MSEGRSVRDNADSPSKEPTVDPDAGMAADVTRFADYLVAERGLSPNTVSTYSVQVRSFLAFLASCGKAPGQAETSDVSSWLARRRAEGMDPRTLKEQFGGKLTFWGGGVDTQKTLPFGTPEEIRRQVRERIEIFGRGGGFVFNTVHNVQAGVPTENLVALYEAIREAR